MPKLSSAYLSPVFGGYMQGEMAQQDLQRAKLANALSQLGLQSQQDLQRASLGSLLDQGAGGGMDPTAATIAALSGNAPMAGGGGMGSIPAVATPSGGGGPGPSPLGLQTSLGPAGPTMQPQAPPQLGPAGPMAAPSSSPMAPPSPGGGPSAPSGAGPSPMPGAPGSPPGGAPALPGMGMSLGQMIRRLKADPRNANIPDVTLLGLAGKAQAILNPDDKLLLQYLMANNRNATTERGQDLTAAYRDSMAAIAKLKTDQPNNQMVPGLGPPGANGQPTYGVYVMDKKSGSPQFVPTGGAVGAGAVSKATGANTFTPEMGTLMAALAEKGVSLPTGFRSKEQQAQLYQGLIARNPGKSPDEIADMVKNGQIDLKALTKETQVAAGQAGKVQVAANELSEFMPLVREASAKVPRGSFMPISRLLQTADNQLSDPNLRALKIRINSLLNAYDQLAARGGTDVNKRAEARSLLTSADSPEVLDAALQSFSLEAEAAKRAATAATKTPNEAAGGGGQAEDPLGLFNK